MFSFSLGSKESVFCSHFSLFGEWPSGLCTILDNKWCCDPSLHPEPSSVSRFFFFNICFFTYLAAPGLSCDMRDFRSALQQANL